MYPLGWRLGAPQSPYGRDDKEKEIPCLEPNLGRSVFSLVTLLTPYIR